ncbi:hypothetical protein TTHERM_00449470 (macronuclear) [Tetrahymena thermophila SB210]|uniref:Ciliary microtubule inner protein 2A-C-like domain-containing protein n=1 Tax=Tetrahymena thermophila (strain SB210) TaxID=312017 RepID=Q238X3_TETTS|nr:hypothetical protein TTHERM_00449470 [Tetrahymena thermophila SB210]EAR93097.3 hypothetical protein TTHERM_00449470 [Tetrahymena thermophila SB210]8G3D_0D Chain 0D, CFAM166A [Tetrahymena thermophila]8G3D_1D Chain 1D, CFAM166A [Tetrahymena thermophila]8G3D_2D Chain 2D, CFAM166A [Tetrahymena thermophila]|eukprot:XP_001013342.3 hypothetical protein TTHERM_00449470 [Tetrahymena thermophila SB210]
MFEGTRLSYVVPGYTGHIPKVIRDDPIPIQKQEPKYQIPGYDGYIPSIKSENIFGKTYGKITYTISKGDQHQGQDVNAQQRYASVTQETYINQNQVLQRTAAEIVGVPPKQLQYTLTDKMKDSNFWQTQLQHTKKLQQEESQNVRPQQFEESLDKFYGDDKVDPIRIGTPLPGYTGTNKRIVAANIFGQTFANARKTAAADQHNIDNEKMHNFKLQAQNIPNIRR